MMNKTRGTSMVPSRLADELEYRTSENTYSGNTNPLGTLDITQKSLNVTYPTIQGAIDDLTGTFLDINTVIINTDGENPAGVSQVDSIKFTGFVTTGADEETTTIVPIFGLPFKFEVNDTAEEVAQKFVTQANEYIAKNEFFNFAQVSSSDPTTVEIRYIDFRYHPPYSASLNGLGIETTISSSHKPGYGTWAKLGTKTETLDAPADPITLYYFKRIA